MDAQAQVAALQVLVEEALMLADDAKLGGIGLILIQMQKLITERDDMAGPDHPGQTPTR